MIASGFVEGPLGGWSQVVTRDGAIVSVEVTTSELIVVVTQPDGRATARATVPCPPAGYGGHELVVSSDDRHVVMFLFSGQCEVGYELFRLRPRLEWMARMPYVYGMGMGPVFSDDAKRLVLAWSTNSGLYVEGEVELDDRGFTTADCTLTWATLHVRSLADDALADDPVAEGRIDVRVPAGFPFEGDDSYLPTVLSVSADAIELDTGWGPRAVVPLPLAPVTLVDGPTSRDATT